MAAPRISKTACFTNLSKQLQGKIKQSDDRTATPRHKHFRTVSQPVISVLGLRDESSVLTGETFKLQLVTEPMNKNDSNRSDNF